MSVNLVVQSGTVANLALRYDPEGRPECRFTLVQEENGFRLYLPCCAAAGPWSEKIAGQISDGDGIVISSGKLTYRKRSTQKFGEQSRLEILVWSVDRLQETRDGSTEGQESGVGAIVEPEPAQVGSVFDDAETSLADINNRGIIVGTFYRPSDGWRAHGFQAVPKPATPPRAVASR